MALPLSDIFMICNPLSQEKLAKYMVNQLGYPDVEIYHTAADGFLAIRQKTVPEWRHTMAVVVEDSLTLCHPGEEESARKILGEEIYNAMQEQQGSRGLLLLEFMHRAHPLPDRSVWNLYSISPGYLTPQKIPEFLNRVLMTKYRQIESFRREDFAHPRKHAL